MTQRSGFAGCALATLVALPLASLVHAEIPALVGGNETSGDQATLILDGAVEFEYQPKASQATGALAYFDRHVFCADIQTAGGSMRFEPRYQLPETVGNDIWKFPDFNVDTLEYVYAGTGFALRVNQTASSSRTRCLTAQPGGSLDPWDADRGLFGEGFGDYIGANYAGVGVAPPQDPPSAPHQNFKVVAQQFPGLVAGREVAVVRVEVQMDATTPSAVDVVLVDAFNANALSPPSSGANPTSDKVSWCLLRHDWVDGTTPPAALCSDASILFPGVSAQTGEFVRQGMGFYPTFPGPFHVLVSREAHGVAAAGTPKQAFAVLHAGGGLSGAGEDLQDWYTSDSVWYTY